MNYLAKKNPHKKQEKRRKRKFPVLLLFSFLFIILYVHVWFVFVYVYTQMYKYMCVFAYGDQRSSLGFFFHCSPHEWAESVCVYTSVGCSQPRGHMERPEVDIQAWEARSLTESKAHQLIMLISPQDQFLCPAPYNARVTDANTAMLGFCVGTRHSNSNPHACEAGTLPM